MEIVQHTFEQLVSHLEIGKEIKKFLDSNENEDTIYPSLWDTAKAVLSDKFLAMSAHIRKLERSQRNNLMIHLKLSKTRTSQSKK
jgi:hypothetical protein